LSVPLKCCSQLGQIVAPPEPYQVNKYRKAGVDHLGQETYNF